MLDLFRKIEERIKYAVKMRDYKKRITQNMSSLEHCRKLTQQQKNEVQSFYKGLIGKEVPLYSHEYFYSRTGVFSKDYVPTNIYFCELLPKANVHPYIDAYRDKNIFDLLFPGENLAHTLVKNMNGYYYVEGRAVPRDEAESYCWNIDDVMIKPASAHSGYGVRKIAVKDGVTNLDNMTIAALFDKYGKNFLIQKCIHQHAAMSALNPTSVNTLRILTFRSGMEVLIIYSVVRIGRLGEVVDNQTAGGMSATIDDNGCLGKYAFGGLTVDNLEKTDSGIVLEGYQLPSYKEALEMVKRLHLHVPHFNIVGWDIAIEENGDPLLVEWNTKPGLSQSAFMSGMGKYTERIVRELWPRENTWFPSIKK